MNTPLFELKEVSYTYEDGTEALQKINLQIDQGKKLLC